MADIEIEIVTTNTLLGLDNICRTCLSRNCTVFKSIFSSITESELLFSDMIMALTALNIKNDNLPTLICMKCIEKLVSAYSFKTTCEQSEKVLLNYATKESEPKKRCLEPDQFKCNICDRSLSSRSAFNKHLKAIHSVKTDEEFIVPKEADSENPYQCPHCPYLLTNINMLKRHIISSHNANKQQRKNEEKQAKEKKYEIAKATTCSYCGDVFQSGEQLQNHLLEKHLSITQHLDETATPEICKLCGMKTQNLKWHIAEHYKYLYCDKCQIKLSSTRAYETHMRKNKHKPVTTYVCDECGKTFLRLNNLQNHSEIHKQQNLHTCDICDKKFGTATYLKQHKVKAHKKLHVCLICTLTFKCLRDLQLHRRNLHHSYGTVGCTKCQKRFNATAQLNKHLVNHECETSQVETQIVLNNQKYLVYSSNN